MDKEGFFRCYFREWGQKENERDGGLVRITKGHTGDTVPPEGEKPLTLCNRIDR